jgi:hypothetical protein
MLSSAYSCINMAWLSAIIIYRHHKLLKDERFAWPVITIKKATAKAHSASHDHRTTRVGTLTDYNKKM